VTDERGGDPTARRGWAAWLPPALGLLLFVAALFAIHRALSEHSFREIAGRLGEIPRGAVLRALLLSALGYLALTGYDALALRHIGRSLPYRRTALASFTNYAFSHNLGFPLLTGGSVRYRLYSSWGLAPVEVATVVVFASATFWLGFALLAGAACLAEPAALAATLHLSPSSLPLLGGALLAAAAAYLLLCLRGGTVRLRGREFALPSPATALAQALLSSADWSLAAAVLFVLLPPDLPLSFPAFLGAFLLAQVAGVASGVPGGLGVFEGALLLLLRGAAPAHLAAALLAYRVAYYLLPLFLAALLLGLHELSAGREAAARAGSAFARWAAPVAPHVFAAAAAASGAVLLLSGATPSLAPRVRLLSRLVPLPVLEASHFLGSLVGVTLLFLARGLAKRLDGAWLLTAALLAAGVVLSLLKGLDYEEAFLLSLLLLALAPARKLFYRKSSLLDAPFSPRWGAALLLVLLGAAWVMAFSFRHVEYSNDLWWTFELDRHSPRALRATTGAAVLALLFGVARLLRPNPVPRGTTTEEELEDAARVALAHPDTTAWLALTGDKRLLFDEGRTAFVMYAVEGRSFVAMGDPAGPAEAGTELAWRFRELADRHNGWSVFYEAGRERLPLYLDLGLSLVKLGEQARVPLEGFSLAGTARKGVRGSVNRAERAGCRFAVLPAEAVPPRVEELRRVSDAWLSGKRTREKGFSLGWFSPSYLARCPLATVTAGGRIVAFANLWAAGGKEELSADLMRYGPEAPPGVMDFLFAELLLWGKAEGYRWFNLGMAPLSGLPDRAPAPLWGKAGSFLYRHGENFYNFRGVREFKAKFDPVWEPRYLALPGKAPLPRVLANVATLVSGGWKGVVTK
jgi:phosphatidylglycerol lysyltransferase